MMEMTVANFKWHVAEISKRFQIPVILDSERERHKAIALNAIHRVTKESVGRVVIAREIDDETSYAVVMHEFGHHLAPDGFCTKQKPKPGAHPREMFEYRAAKLVCEEAAWTWARYYIEQVFIWTVAMEQVRYFGINGYTEARRTGR